MGGYGLVSPYTRATAERLALRAVALASRGYDAGLRSHLLTIQHDLGALGLPPSGLASWFLTIVYLTPEIGLDDTVVATLYEGLWDRHGNDGVATARFFLNQGDVEAARAIVATLLQHRADDPEVKSLAVTCRLVSGFAGASRRRPSA